MNDAARKPGQGAGGDAGADGPEWRLAAYVARTQTALDVLALATLWLCVVPPDDFGTAQDTRNIALILRIAVSAVYGVDILIRSILARRHVRYLFAHPLATA